MVKIIIDFENEELQNLSNKPKIIQRSIISDATQDMVRFLIQNSPYDHGKLRGWFIEYLKDTESSIKSPANYALYQDQGTKPYSFMVRPKNKKALFWGEMGDDGKPIMSKGHVIHHPGLKGKHFVEKSFQLVKPRMGGYLKKAMESK